MAIKLTPERIAEIQKLEKDAKPAFEPIPAGTVCDFEVLREGKAYGKDVFTEDKMSKGNEEKGTSPKPMLVAVLRLYYQDQKRTLVVYLTDGDSKYEQWRLKSFFASLGYAKATAEEVIGATGRLSVDIEEREYNGKTTSNNIVKEFLIKGVEVELDDEMPVF